MLKILIVLLLALTGCQSKVNEEIIHIQVSDEQILVEGNPISKEINNVYLANDIIYYEEGKDFTYGEGDVDDAHSASDALKHQVIHISEPGNYQISGKLSYGQIAIDLGSDAKKDPNAVVNLILDGLDIHCDVAPAIIFYNVYECGNTDKASKDVDTKKAGANVIIKDDTINNVSGSYVARIYKEGSVVLNEEGNEVVDAKKLHKYDGAFYSKMSMNVNGNNGILNIIAENEGLDSELHLTINGGIINITSGNDGINTNEDGISVTTINGGELNIKVTGETGEGDGIDSNGWLVINGGSVFAQACSFSGDAGIDSDNGIHINGGKVIATGNMLDRIEENGQTYAVFSFSNKMNQLTLKNEDKEIMNVSNTNNFSILIYSDSNLKEGNYTLWNNGVQLKGSSGMMNQRPNMPGNNMEPPNGGFGGNNMEPPKDGFNWNNTEPPKDIFDGKEPPKDGFNGNQPPMDGFKPGGPNGFNPENNQELSYEFNIKKGSNYYSNVQ